jgi:serine protease Do
VITSVEPGSPAAKKRIKVGDVILEVRQKRVRKPEEVVAWLSAIRKSGRDKILFLLANADGDLRLVNVPIS